MQDFTPSRSRSALCSAVVFQFLLLWGFTLRQHNNIILSLKTRQSQQNLPDHFRLFTLAPENLIYSWDGRAWEWEGELRAGRMQFTSYTIRISLFSCNLICSRKCRMCASVQSLSLLRLPNNKCSFTRRKWDGKGFTNRKRQFGVWQGFAMEFFKVQTDLLKR